MLEALVTSAGLTLGNAELLWIRSDDPADTVALIAGSSFESTQQEPDRWLYFATSLCLQWHPEFPGCLDSELQVALTVGVCYDVVAWTEAENRQDPQRDVVAIADRWPFRPGDIDMDGVVSCGDLELFTSSPYDWNLDGETTAADAEGVTKVVAQARADLDGDGVNGEGDLLVLLQQWGTCPAPPDPCPADLNCDGKVAVQDFLLLLEQFGL